MSRSYDWSIIPGDDESRTFEYNSGTGTDIDLTGYTVESKFDVGGTIHTATAEVLPPATAGKVKVSLTDTQTKMMRTIGTWYVRITKDGVTTTLAHGMVIPDVV
jgi:hypothetical protein